MNDVAQMPSRRPSGFRFSAADALIIAAGAPVTWLAWRVDRELAVLPPVVLIHFFLFCNVFRIRRSYELIWAAAFVVNLTAWAASGEIPWPAVLLVQSPVTVAVIAAEVRGERYHGVGCHWLGRNEIREAHHE